MNVNRRRSPSAASRLHRALLALAVIGSLLTVPIAATAHELGHLKSGASDRFDQKSEPTSACEVCAAYTGLGHALAFEPAAVQAARLLAPDERCFALRADRGRFRLYFERAPPHSSASV